MRIFMLINSIIVLSLTTLSSNSYAAGECSKAVKEGDVISTDEGVGTIAIIQEGEDGDSNAKTVDVIEFLITFAQSERNGKTSGNEVYLLNDKGKYDLIGECVGNEVKSGKTVKWSSN